MCSITKKVQKKMLNARNSSISQQIPCTAHPPDQKSPPDQKKTGKDLFLIHKFFRFT